MVNALLLILFITFIANFAIGLFVYFKNPKRIINQIFSVFAIGVAGWNFTIFALLAFPADIWVSRLAFSFGGIMTAGFLSFAITFPEREKLSKIISYLLVPLMLILFIVPLAGDLFVKTVSVGAAITGTFGPLYPIYMPFLPLFILLSIIVFIYKYLKVTGVYKLQLKYVFLGGSAFLILMIATNLILPFFFNVFDYNIYGPAFTIFMITATAYTIVRYHLMDIWVVVRLGTIYAVLFSVVTFVYTFATSTLGNYVEGRMGIILPTLLLTFGFMPLKNLIETATDRIFFRKQFRYENLIRKFNELIHSFSFDLNQLLQSFNALITGDLKASHAAILLTIPKGTFIPGQLISSSSSSSIRVEVSPDNPIINFFHQNPREILDREVLRVRPEMAPNEVISELDRLNFSLILPIISKDQLIGIYGIGPKKSQDAYGSEEVELFRFLAREGAHVIDNARYFEDLKKIDAAKSKFISVTSHELRTPLTSILWNLEFLLSRKIKNKIVNEMLGYVYYSASFINDHLDDMLTTLDIEEHKDNIFLKKERFQFAEALQEAMDAVKPDAEKKRINFDIALSTSQSEVEADRGKVKKILLALLRNAALYSPLGGKVYIQGEVKGVNGQSFYECSVRDEGMGITEEEKPSIFAKFYRSDAARLASPNGFGISLFIAKNFVEAHGGEMWFSSLGRDRGVTFYFKIPLHNKQL